MRTSLKQIESVEVKNLTSRFLIFLGCSHQLLQNKFFDPIIPSMRTSKIQNGRQGAPKWPTGSGKGCIPRFLGAPVNFCYKGIFIWALLLWEKVVTEKIGKEKNSGPLSSCKSTAWTTADWNADRSCQQNESTSFNNHHCGGELKTKKCWDLSLKSDIPFSIPWIGVGVTSLPREDGKCTILSAYISADCRLMNLSFVTLYVISKSPKDRDEWWCLNQGTILFCRV